jgi:hypothetical protein
MKEFVVMQATHDDAGGDRDFVGEGCHSTRQEVSGPQELAILLG